MATKRQDLKQVVKERLEKWGVTSRDFLVVAVSGGVDSMTLLTVLAKLIDANKLIIVHVNHGLRKTAVRDERLVFQYAKDLGIVCVIKKVRLTQKSGIEERARELRYRALRQVAKKTNAKYILTAHTADDQVETIVFNFLRGAGFRGLAGMQEVSQGIARPFLSVYKRELISYAKRNRVPYVTDETNLSSQFTRNRIRLELMPILRKYNPKVDEQIWSTGELISRAEQSIRNSVRAQLTTIATIGADKIVISASKFRELDSFTQAEMLKVAMESLGVDLVGLKRAHFEEAARFVSNLTGKGSSKKIGGKLWLARGYDKITVTKSL